MLKTLIYFFLAITTVFSKDSVKTGILMGKVYDAEIKMPLPGVNVYIKNQNIGAATDVEGNYKIENLAVGSYTIVYSFIGYNSLSATDIIIRSDRITYKDAGLYSSSVEMDSIIVTGGFFSDLENNSISAVEYSAEEIRRAPGSAGDVSRILFGLPSIAKVNDGKSSLMVRGGSPIENSFYLDNIEIDNINHFATQGSSDGLFGILNIDFVNDVTFYAGGFSPVYGDKLSSVMEISFREGNRNEYDAQINLNFSGAGAQFEGPFANKKGSFLISANKSYLDLLMKTFANGYPAPEYYDAQAKAVYNLSSSHKLSLINIFANDVYNVQYDKALDKEFNQYGETNYITNTIGINWMYLWGKSGYSNTSISNTINKRDIILNETKSRSRFLKNNMTENNISLRNTNYYKINEEHKFDFGVESKLRFNTFNYTIFEYLDEFGNIVPISSTLKKLNTFSGSAFLVYHASFINNLTISIGGRSDFFNFNDKLLFSPRSSISYRFDPLTTLSASAGLYYQNIPSLILAQSDEFKNLLTPKAVHYVLSLSRLLTADTRLTIEAYIKDYSNLPIDPSQPASLGAGLFDQVVSSGLFTNYDNLISKGDAISKGIELMIQKKLARDFYGMISASFSSAKYKDLNGTLRNRIYDNRYNFNIEGGYKPNNEWEFSLRFIYAGGAPYTPFDIALSKEYNKGILDLKSINGNRLPDYHSLNLRVDKRFYFERTNLVLFLSIWNVYNHDNISAYTWNEVKNHIAKEIGWNTIPVFGVEYEF